MEASRCSSVEYRAYMAARIVIVSPLLYGTILRLSMGLAQTGKHRGVRTRLRSAGGEISHGSTPERCVVWRTFWGRVVNRSCRAREPRGGPTIFGGVAPEKSVARQGFFSGVIIRRDGFVDRRPSRVHRVEQRRQHNCQDKVEDDGIEGGVAGERAAAERERIGRREVHHNGHRGCVVPGDGVRGGALRFLRGSRKEICRASGLASGLRIC